MWYVWPHQLKYKVTTPKQQQGLLGNNILGLLGNNILINLVRFILYFIIVYITALCVYRVGGVLVVVVVCLLCTL